MDIYQSKTGNGIGGVSNKSRRRPSCVFPTSESHHISTIVVLTFKTTYYIYKPIAFTKSSTTCLLKHDGPSDVLNLVMG